MNVRFADNSEKSDWNALIIANPDGGNVFQGVEFAKQKETGGWKPRYIIAGNTAITALERSVSGLGKLWYLPKGPGVQTVKQLAELLPDLKDFALKHKVFAVKIEPELRKEPVTLRELKKLDLVSVSPIQPNYSTVLIDLSRSQDEILADMNQGARRAIRRAEKDGVVIKEVPSSDKNCKLFYELLSETAAGSFVIRPYEYYHKFWQRYSDAGSGQLFFAFVDGRAVAGAYIMTFGDTSIYKDGASRREKAAYGVGHLLHRHILWWAKDRGVKTYDFCGAPPSDQVDNKDHPHYGIGLFKTSFNKQITDYVGAYDVVIRPHHYGIWSKFGERAVKSIWWRTHHESWY